MTDNTQLTAEAIAFQPGMEHEESNESMVDVDADTILKGIRENTYKYSGHARRSLHAKSHGIVLGTLSVLENLPPTLAQGLFSKPEDYKAVMRFSTLPGMILKDSVSMPRGVALKIQRVRGDRLPDSPGNEQDFLLVNAPTFGARTVKEFNEFIGSVVAKLSDESKGLAVADNEILGETFYSQTPFLFGQHICKFALVPVSAALKARTNKHIDVSGKANALLDSVVEYFAKESGDWELKVQLNTSLQSMPIEDSTVSWPQDKSPYITVARLSVPVQNAWSPTNIATVDEGMSFNPWNGLAAHRPLGSINRARKPTYATSVSFRQSHSRDV
jgi:catalase